MRLECGLSVLADMVYFVLENWNYTYIICHAGENIWRNKKRFSALNGKVYFTLGVLEYHIFNVKWGKKTQISFIME